MNWAESFLIKDIPVLKRVRDTSASPRTCKKCRLQGLYSLIAEPDIAACKNAICPKEVLPICHILVPGGAGSKPVNLNHSVNTVYMFKAFNAMYKMHSHESNIIIISLDINEDSLQVGIERDNALFWYPDNELLIEAMSAENAQVVLIDLLIKSFTVDGHTIDGHANLLAIDVKRMQLVRYEPQGGNNQDYHENFDNEAKVDYKLLELAEYLGCTYHDARETTPNIGPQRLENYIKDDVFENVFMSVDGFCVTWTLWYAHVILTALALARNSHREFYLPFKADFIPLMRCFRLTSHMGSMAPTKEYYTQSTIIDVDSNSTSEMTLIPRGSHAHLNMKLFIVGFAARLTSIVYPDWKGEAVPAEDIEHFEVEYDSDYSESA